MRRAATESRLLIVWRARASARPGADQGRRRWSPSSADDDGVTRCRWRRRSPGQAAAVGRHSPGLHDRCRRRSSRPQSSPVPKPGRCRFRRRPGNEIATAPAATPPASPTAQEEVPASPYVPPPSSPSSCCSPRWAPALPSSAAVRPRSWRPAVYPRTCAPAPDPTKTRRRDPTPEPGRSQLPPVAHDRAHLRPSFQRPARARAGGILDRGDQHQCGRQRQDLKQGPSTSRVTRRIGVSEPAGPWIGDLRRKICRGRLRPCQRPCPPVIQHLTNDGSGAVNRQEKISTTIAAVVSVMVRPKPNANLVIQGAQEW